MSRRWGAIIALLILAWACLQSQATAQQDPNPQIAVDAVDASQFPTVRITVTVRDSSGVPVSDVPLSAFALSEGDRSLQLTSVVTASTEDGGVSAVLAFDVSGSMAGRPLEIAKAAGKSLIAQLGSNDLVAVLAFGDSVRTVLPFSNDLALLTSAIDGLSASGNTALYQAVAQSAAQFAGNNSSRRAIVLLSDGTEYGGLSTASRATSLDAARVAAAPVFAVGLGASIDDQYLSDLSAVTGGVLSLAPGPDSLEGLYESIGAVLGRQHVVTFNAASIDSPTNLRLQVDYGGASTATEFPFEAPPIVNGPVEQRVEPVPREPATGGQLPAGQDLESTGEIAIEPDSDEQDSRSSGSAIPVVVVIAGASVLLIVGLLFAIAYVRRRRRSIRARGNLPEESLVELLRRSSATGLRAARVRQEAGETRDRPDDRRREVALLKVPSNGQEISYPVDGSPVTLGFSRDCDVVLPGNGSGRYERVRLWQRDGRFMLHNLSGTGQVNVGGKPVSWLILEDGDSINIGGCHVVFHSSGS